MKLLLRLVSTALLVQLSTTELSTTELSVDHATNVDTKQQNDIPGIFTNLLRELTKEELQALMVAQGERFTETYPGGNEIYKKIHYSTFNRPKRALGFAGLRSFLRSYTKDKVTRSGQRITQHYFKSGNYNTALQEFQRLNPTGVKALTNSKFQGLTGILRGTAGNVYTITVRSGSKGVTGVDGSPTLSIATRAGNLIRKFRFKP